MRIYINKTYIYKPITVYLYYINKITLFLPSPHLLTKCKLTLFTQAQIQHAFRTF